MIFKTFNNNIDKISAKWGILGKSFYDFVEIANKRKIKLDDLITYKGMSLEEARTEVGSLWSNWFPSKSDLKSKITDIDSLIPKFDTDMAREELENLQNIQNTINETKGSWDDYNKKFEEGKEYLLKYAKQNNVLEASVDDIKQVNQAAREATIAHNAALKQQTLGAKTATVATKALATAGNMIAFLLISKGIELAAVAIDNYINRVEKCKERVNDIVSTFNYAIDTANAHKNSINEIALRYNELSKGVDNLGQNVSLTTDEYSEYTAIANQIAEMFPSMVQGYTNEGNAILKLKGNVNALTDAYEAEAQAAYNSLIASGEDSNGNDIITDWKNSLSEDKGNGTNITQAIKELEAFITSDMDAEMYTALKEKASAGIYDGMTDAEKLISSSQLIPLKIKLDLNENGIITDEEFAVAKKSAKDLLHKYNTEIEIDFSNTNIQEIYEIIKPYIKNSLIQMKLIQIIQSI